MGLPASEFVTEPNNRQSGQAGPRIRQHHVHGNSIASVHRGITSLGTGGFSSVHTGMLPISKATGIAEMYIGVRTHGDPWGLSAWV